MLHPHNEIIPQLKGISYQIIQRIASKTNMPKKDTYLYVYITIRFHYISHIYYEIPSI
jgi:hypothetical protein